MVRLSNIKFNRRAVLALSIVAGAVAPDILDHILIRTDFQYDYGKGWAHSILVCLLVLAVLSVAYLLRHHIKRLVLK